MRVLHAAAVAALLVGVAAPGAAASHVEADCTFESITQQDVTGPDVYEGSAFGYATAAGDALAVRCVVFVNGVEAEATPYGPTTPNVAVTGSRLTFTAGVEDVVELCAEVTTTAHGVQVFCPYSVPPMFPPQWVIDALDTALDPAWDAVDAQLCPALGAQSPGTPPVTIDPTGDVYVDGELTWDCPPYAWA